MQAYQGWSVETRGDKPFVIRNTGNSILGEYGLISARVSAQAGLTTSRTSLALPDP